MSLTTLAHHPLLTHYLRFISTTVGRDKALRTLQYLARFLSWYLLRKGYTAASIAPWNTIKSSFGTARKAMRLGKNAEHFKAASIALESTSKVSDPLTAYLATGRQLGYFLYLSFDNASFLNSLGVLRVQPKTAARLQREAQRFWLVGIMFSVVSGVYSLRKLADKERGVVKTEAEGRLAGEKIVKDRKALKTQLLSDCADALIPAAGLGWVSADDGVVGLAGLVSSVIGLKAAWKKVA